MNQSQCQVRTLISIAMAKALFLHSSFKSFLIWATQLGDEMTYHRTLMYSFFLASCMVCKTTTIPFE